MKPLSGTIIINGNPTQFEECFSKFAFGENSDELIISGRCDDAVKSQIASVCEYKEIKVQ